MLRNLYLFILATGLTFSLKAQDIHFSQFFLSPLTLNPAHNGNFEGSVRFGGIYRTQWWGLAPYNTFSASADSPIMKGFKDEDWLGVGFVAFSDRAGDLGLNYTGAWLGASYHLALDKDRNSVFSIGVQGGTVSRDFDQILVENEENVFLSEITTGMRSQDRGALGRDSGNDQRGGRTDWSAGLLFQSVLGESAYLTLGGAVHHIAEPNKSVIQQGNYRLPRRINLHGSLTLSMSDRLYITPMVLFSQVETTGEINFAALASFDMQNAKNITLNFGAGHRLGDALEAYLGFDVGDFRVGAAYDIPFASVGRSGAFEIGAQYIAKIYKKPKVDNILFCPRF